MVIRAAASLYNRGARSNSYLEKRYFGIFTSHEKGGRRANKAIVPKYPVRTQISYLGDI